MKTRLFVGLLGACLMLAPLGAAEETKRKAAGDKQDSDMQRAIAFEKHKDAASAQQARMEARHPSVSNDNADRRADRDDDNTQGRKVIPKNK